MSAPRDRDAFDALVGLLRDTLAFADVLLDWPLDRVRVGGDRTPLAVIVPTEWNEVADGGPNSAIRHVQFTLSVAVRGDDAAARFQQLDQLTNLCQAVIVGSSLGGRCIRGMTRLAMGRFDQVDRHPEQRVYLFGEFAFAVPSVFDRDVSG